MSNFVAFRPGKKHPHIAADLEKYKNQSARIRELYLLGLAVERGEYVKAADIPQVLVAKQPSEAHLAEFKAQWERLQQGGFVRPAAPVEPLSVAYAHVAVTAATGSEEEDDIRQNMLGGFD